MNIIFRTDASLDIGTGHFMRCLTLADALRERGAECRFVCREHAGNLLDVIRQRGFEAYGLPLGDAVTAKSDVSDNLLPLHAAWLGADWASDAEQTLAAIGDTKFDWLIVDHYALDARWEHRLRCSCHRLMVIDDLADRVHDCDLLLDQNLGRTAADYKERVPATCTVLAGAQYALLRPEFAALRAYSLERRAHPKLKRLLITMGGVDKYNATGQVLDALRECALPADCSITVVMGPQAPWLAKVREKAVTMPWPTAVRVNVRDMAKLMANSDLAIGAAGTSAWERCCLGLPTLTLVLANNQQEGAKALEAAGAVMLLSNRNALVSDLQAKLSLCVRPEGLEAMQRACSSITDGTSVAQLAGKLINVRN